MQMRTRDPAGGARQAHSLALFYDVAHFHQYLREVQVHRVHAQSMIEEYGVAVEEEVLGQHNAAGIGSEDFRAG